MLSLLKYRDKLPIKTKLPIEKDDTKEQQKPKSSFMDGLNKLAGAIGVEIDAKTFKEPVSLLKNIQRSLQDRKSETSDTGKLPDMPEYKPRGYGRGTKSRGTLMGKRKN